MNKLLLAVILQMTDSLMLVDTLPLLSLTKHSLLLINSLSSTKEFKCLTQVVSVQDLTKLHPSLCMMMKLALELRLFQLVPVEVLFGNIRFNAPTFSDALMTDATVDRQELLPRTFLQQATVVDPSSELRTCSLSGLEPLMDSVLHAMLLTPATLLATPTRSLVILHSVPHSSLAATCYQVLLSRTSVRLKP